MSSVSAGPAADISRDEAPTPLDLLVEKGKLSPGAIERAQLAVGEGGDERLEFTLVKLGLVSDQDVADVFAEVADVPRVQAVDLPDDPVDLDKLNPTFLTSSRIVPLAAGDQALDIAVADPFDDFALSSICFAIKKKVTLKVASVTDIDLALERLYGQDEPDERADGLDLYDENLTADAERLRDLASEAPVIRLVNRLIEQAVDSGASDIHFEPFESRLAVRYRLDGVLRDIETPPFHLAQAIVSRVKIMAKLNIAERRLPQDGRIRVAVQGRDIDFRVSTSPTVHGESVVLRILDRSSLTLNFEDLGFSGQSYTAFMNLLDRPHGILLVTGPTGSGKTTTLYAALEHLNVPDRKILTVEDPVEYMLDGINQVQVHTEIGRDFARTLRSFLRQDPDVMMVGEIRDKETARIAVQAALTGHLVFSTVHTNDAASGITRLLDIGVDDFLLSSTVIGLVGQRLVRKLCVSCREAYQPAPELCERLGIDRADATLYKHVGCDACGGTGYAGRTALYEVLTITDEIRTLVMGRGEAKQIADAAVEGGFVTMFRDGVEKAMAGITSLEEVMRVTTDT